MSAICDPGLDPFAVKKKKKNVIGTIEGPFGDRCVEVICLFLQLFIELIVHSSYTIVK